MMRQLISIPEECVPSIQEKVRAIWPDMDSEIIEAFLPEGVDEKPFTEIECLIVTVKLSKPAFGFEITYNVILEPHNGFVISDFEEVAA